MAESLACATTVRPTAMYPFRLSCLRISLALFLALPGRMVLTRFAGWSYHGGGFCSLYEQVLFS